jgi:predicted DNA-binding transcriptional regulator AlpA
LARAGSQKALILKDKMTSLELDNPTNPPENLLSDEQVAKLLNLSVAWIRKQRYLRRKDQPHVFTVEPVLIGGVPRYRPSEIQSWLASL